MAWTLHTFRHWPRDSSRAISTPINSYPKSQIPTRSRRGRRRSISAASSGAGFRRSFLPKASRPRRFARLFQRRLRATLRHLQPACRQNRLAVRDLFPNAEHNEVARTLRVCDSPKAGPSDRSSLAPTNGSAAVITAGTSDLPVAEEARETLDWMGVRTTMIYDVGVAGPHRLIERLAEFRNADAIVVVAGMEGALPSIVGGHVDSPVIAVPTSVGYGASFGGVAALLGMLNSCASNVVVVNIDAGFKAGYVAGMIAGGRRRMSNDEIRMRKE